MGPSRDWFSPQIGWAALAFLSGLPALMAQVVWARQVALTSGAASKGLALVVAAFFADLAVGVRVLGPPLERTQLPGPRPETLELARQLRDEP